MGNIVESLYRIGLNESASKSEIKNTSRTLNESKTDKVTIVVDFFPEDDDDFKEFKREMAKYCPTLKLKYDSNSAYDQLKVTGPKKDVLNWLVADEDDFGGCGYGGEGGTVGIEANMDWLEEFYPELLESVDKKAISEAVLTERKAIFKSNGTYTGEIDIIDDTDNKSEVTLSQIGINDEDKFINTIKRCKTQEDVLKVLRKFTNSKLHWSIDAKHSTDEASFFIASGFFYNEKSDKGTHAVISAIVYKKITNKDEDDDVEYATDLSKYKKAIADVYKSMASEIGEEDALNIVKSFASVADKHYSKLDLGD